MKKLILVVILIGVFLAGILTGPAFSQPNITIDFDTRFPNCSEGGADDFPVPSDLYRDLGVLFSAINPDGTQAYIWGECGYPSVLDPPYEGGVFSLPNAIKGYLSSAYPVVADFVVPNTDEPGITSYVKVGVSSGPGPDYLSENVALQAYDIDGNLIAEDLRDLHPEYDYQFDYLEVSAPNIAQVIMVAGLRRETFDDFEFSPVTAIECTSDADCDDGEYCNGAETCVFNACTPGIPVDCDDDVSCTDDSCDEVNDICVYSPNDANCDDDLFCTGVEICDPDLDCQLGTPPCDPGEEVCDELNDVCAPIGGCQSNADCDDGEYCNGAETCVGGICEGGTTPCDPQTELCYEDNDVCVPAEPEAKVIICHIPPGNPSRAKTLSVGVAAVPAHLAHGDTLGQCP